MTQKSVKIKELWFLNPNERPRIAVDWEVVKHYQEIIKSLPDIRVAAIKADSELRHSKKEDWYQYLVVGGLHRYFAIDASLKAQGKSYEEIMNTTIVVDLDPKIKTLRQAKFAMVEDNVKHGLQYTDEDRAQGARVLIGAKYTQKQIAKLFGVDPSTVSRWLKPVSAAKKADIADKVGELKDKGMSVRKITKKLQDEGVEVSSSTVHRIITEEPKRIGVSEERTIEDTTNYDKCIEHLQLIQRHLTGYKRVRLGFVPSEAQDTKLLMMIEEIIKKSFEFIQNRLDRSIDIDEFKKGLEVLEKGSS